MNGGSRHEPVRTTRDPQIAHEWGVVLTARGIPFELDLSDGEIRLWALPGDFDRARMELAAFDAEDVAALPRPEVPRWGRSAIGFVLGWLLLAAHGAMSGKPRLLVLGSARAELLLGGEPWRAVTALTLHADLPHALGNAAFGGALLTAAAWRVGPGVAMALTLVAGIAGNLLTAALYESRHDAIGASTAVFGTLGLLTAMALFDARRFGVRRRAPWVLVGASLALLGFLGSTEGSDILAHFAGWACGLALGLPVMAAFPSPTRAIQQWCLLLSSAAVVAVGWILALQ